VCALDQITAVVTDDHDRDAVASIQTAGVTVLCAQSTQMSMNEAG
jgi:hypothetical protein